MAGESSAPWAMKMGAGFGAQPGAAPSSGYPSFPNTAGIGNQMGLDQQMANPEQTVEPQGAIPGNGVNPWGILKTMLGGQNAGF